MFRGVVVCTSALVCSGTFVVSAGCYHFSSSMYFVYICAPLKELFDLPCSIVCPQDWNSI